MTLIHLTVLQKLERKKMEQDAKIGDRIFSEDGHLINDTHAAVASSSDDIDYEDDIYGEEAVKKEGTSTMARSMHQDLLKEKEGSIYMALDERIDQLLGDLIQP